MSLKATTLSNDMKAFITQVNALKQEDKDKAIDEFCQKLESVVYTAIRSLTLTIPSGAIQVVGQGSATNPAPIVLTGGIS